MVNILTFDIEEWFHANYACVDMERCRSQNSGFREQMDTLLAMCAKNDCHATFFVLGSIGEDYPDVIRKISNGGHEIASHGYGHELAYNQTIDEFRNDVKKSVDILENITGVRVKGYRAPSWSIIKRNYHYLEVLEELGLQYDASIFPVKTFLYGIPDAPKHIYKPVVNNKTLNLYEVPMSVTNVCGKNIGFSGGFYFRFFPRWFIKRSIAAMNKKGQNAIVYLHPREIDPTENRLSLRWQEKFIHYHNIKGVKKKLHDVMNSFKFISITEYLQLHEVRKLV